MKKLGLSLACWCAFAAAGSVMAQMPPAAPPQVPMVPMVPPPAASAASAVRPGPAPGLRPLSPSERRNNGTPLDETMPEGKALPQVAIPLRGQAPATRLKPAPESPRSGVSDDAARCLAEETEAARAACSTKSAKAAKP